MKFNLSLSTICLVFSLCFPAFSSSSIKIEAFAGDLFFPVYGADAEAVIKDSCVKRGNDSPASCLVASGGFFCAKPDLSRLNADFYSGWGKAGVAAQRFDFSVSCFGASLPGETKILSKKPRFVLKDGDFLGASSSLTFRFSQDISVAISVLAATGGFGWGDLYYFYSHPKKTDIYAGFLSASLPFKTDIFGLCASLEFKLAADNTEVSANLGHAGGNLAVFGAQKRFLGEKDEKLRWLSLSKPPRSQNRHTLDALALFAYLDYFGSVLATSETQDYFFFPYEKVRGHAEGKLFAAGGGFSYKYERPALKAGIDAVYLHCFYNPSSADYSYKYKKNILFDGASGASGFDIADFSSCGILAGKVSLSYSFKKLLRLKKASPELKAARIFVLPVLTDSARSSLHFSSSASSSSFSNAGLSSSKVFSRLKTVLLAGTVLSLKVEY